MQNELFEPGILNRTPILNLEILNEVGQGWEMEWTLLRRGGVSVDLMVLHTPRIQFSFERYRGSYLLQGTPPKGTVILSQVWSDAPCSFRNGSVGNDEVMVLKSGEELDGIFNGLHHFFTMAVEERFFLETFRDCFGVPLEEARQKSRLSIESEKRQSFIAYMQKWFRYFETNGNAEVSLSEYRRIEEEILSFLFSLLSVRNVRVSGENQDRQLRRARELLHTKIEEFYCITELATELGMSLRTLQHRFRNRLGVTPKQYLQALRLQAIREELLRAEKREFKIYEVALRYGYFHIGHFNREYKKMFGETPTETYGKNRGNK